VPTTTDLSVGAPSKGWDEALNGHVSMGMANGFANETVRDGGDDARHRRRSRGLSPDQRDETERLRRWETRVVALITQRSRVQIPPPLLVSAVQGPFPIRRGAFCVPGTVVKGVVGAGLRAAWQRDGGDTAIRDEPAWTGWTFPPAVSGRLAQRPRGAAVRRLVLAGGLVPLIGNGSSPVVPSLPGTLSSMARWHRSYCLSETRWKAVKFATMISFMRRMAWSTFRSCLSASDSCASSRWPATARPGTPARPALGLSGHRGLGEPVDPQVRLRACSSAAMARSRRAWPSSVSELTYNARLRRSRA
jgi:hypothetical protein